MSVFNNPVGRLHDLLKIIITDSNETAGSALASNFGIATDDSTAILRVFTSMAQLADQSKEDIRRTLHFPPAILNHLIEPLDKVVEVLSDCSVNSYCTEIEAELPPEILAALVTTAVFLEREYTGQLLSQEEVDALLQKVRDFEEEIVASTLDSALKDKILGNLDAIARALRDYRLYGSERVRAAAESGVGSGIIEASRHRNDPSVYDAMTKYAGFCGGIVSVVDLGTKTKELLEPVLKALTGGS